ncbi:MAG: lanthionine synthetase C family protein [Pseudonocardiaceae bacterium]
MAQTTVPNTTRERAGQIVAELAERLADPDRVAAAATAPDNVDYWAGLPAPQPPWTGLSLAEGHTGVALLYAELSHTTPGHRTTTHAHLTTAVQLATAARDPSTSRVVEGLFSGPPSLAFAACIGQHDPNDYVKLLDQLDEQVTTRLRALLAQEEERLSTRHAGAPMEAYDTINGASGLGRYLLLRQPRHRELLADTLSYLVRLTRPVEVDGHTVPGWWAPLWGLPGELGLDSNPRIARGHFNPGLAHGICGPLALLALSWQADIRVPGQEEAIAQIANHLLAFQPESGLWPTTIGFDEFIATSRHAPTADNNPISWCYGTPGVARVLYLAGRALNRDDWQQQAIQALDNALALAAPPHITDCTLCHGWAGLLQITWRIAHDSADQRLTKQLSELARPILAAYDADLPFGFYYGRSLRRPGWRVAPHQAGFLKGAAGIALALHTYATDREPSRNWDAALLIS